MTVRQINIAKALLGQRWTAWRACMDTQYLEMAGKNLGLNVVHNLTGERRTCWTLPDIEDLAGVRLIGGEGKP